MKVIRVSLIIIVVLMITSCAKSNTRNDVYVNGNDGEADTAIYLNKPGIKADSVVKDARLYLSNEEVETVDNFIGLNMNSDDVIATCAKNNIKLDEPIVMYAGDVMTGWWNDGVSHTSIDDQLDINFDKAGNVYEIEIYGAYETSRGVGVGSTLKEVNEKYGEASITVSYDEDDLQMLSYAMDGFYIRFMLENKKVVGVKISETVMEYVLYEFL